MAEAASGIVVRRISNVYWVATGRGEFACQVRSRMRKERLAVLIGDEVLLEALDEANMKGVITGLAPRRNALSRPPIANVDQVVLVFAADQPAFSAHMLDRFLTLVAMNGLMAIIVVNKADLVSPEALASLVEPYRSLGYRVIASSARNRAVEPLAAVLAGAVSVFAGPSGVGKSSLLNALDAALELRAADVSRKLGRGRHTTTHASLHGVAGGLVADTPGYSHLEFPAWPPEELGWLFPEMAPHATGCRLSKCLHEQEPGCSVRENAHVSPTRRESYERFLGELRQRDRSARASSRKVEGAVKQAGGGEGRMVVRLAQDARQGSRRQVRQQLADFAHLEDEALEPEAGGEEA